MTNVLIRNVPEGDLQEIRAAAALAGTSLQGYLRVAVHAQAVYLRRQSALVRVSERLEEAPAVPEAERAAVLAAIDRANDDRADQLSGPREQ